MLFHIINSNTLRRCCRADMTEKMGGYSRERKRSGEEKACTAGNTKRIKVEKKERLANSYVNVATSPYIFTIVNI
jgi:hypothetical protein